MFLTCKPFLFFDQFFAILSVLGNERDHCTVMALLKKPVMISSDAEKQFSSLLTPYASEFVLKQLLLHKKVTMLNQTNEGFTVSSSEGTVQYNTLTQ